MDTLALEVIRGNYNRERSSHARREIREIADRPQFFDGAVAPVFPDGVTSPRCPLPLAGNLRTRSWCGLWEYELYGSFC
jgi:hypothetical protein